MVSKRVKYGFGIGDLGGNLFFTIIGFYLLYFLTDMVYLSAALAGAALMVGKIWDAITDPITGYYSDRTRSRWGRRRPYMFVGSIISFFCMGWMFTKPAIDTQIPLFIYVTFIYCLLNTAYTLVNIPYAALLPELTDDYHERTVLTGYRMSFAVIGTFVGAAAVMPLVGLLGSWSLMGYVMGAVMLFSSLITIWAIKEPSHLMVIERKSFILTYKEALKNRVFLTALVPWTLFITGASMVQGALVYYFTYIYGNEGLFQFALVFLLTTSLLCIPLWVFVSSRIGKKATYAIGITILSVGVMVFSLAGELIGPTGAVIVMALSGVGLSTHYVMPHAILPDIVEHDSITYNEVRREGVFSSLWTFFSKIGQAFALFLNGWMLSLFAYNPQSFNPKTVIAIKLICGPIPVMWFLIGLAVLHFYPITKEYYEEMIAQRGETLV